MEKIEQDKIGDIDVMDGFQDNAYWINIVQENCLVQIEKYSIPQLIDALKKFV